jgi:hypothetical protein
MSELIGLASLARTAFGGDDLSPLRKLLLDRVAINDNDASALLDLSTVLQLMGNRDCGLSLQALALAIRQHYQSPCLENPAQIRLLAILSPGDLAENNALEFLVEGSDIALDLLYVAPDLPFPAILPDHDLAIVAICESDRNRPLLEHIETLRKSWPRPMLCPPGKIARLSRDGASALLHSAPGIVMPATLRIDRHSLEGIESFPITVRPVDSHKGQGLKKLDNYDAITAYLAERPESEFYIAPYVDFRSQDGQFRKYRIVMIDGRPYACHMAVSANWIVHYLSSDMTGSPEKRAEESQFFADFDTAFARRHHAALLAVADRVELEYFGIDCAETSDGKLLVFEIDSGMTVHAMDPIDIFPYKQPQMRKVFAAFRQMLLDCLARTCTTTR